MTPRLLTAEQAKRVRHFYYWTNLGSEFLVWLFWPVGAYWGLSYVVSLVFSQQIDDQYMTINVYLVLLPLIIGWRIYRRWRAAAHALEAYQFGQQVPIYFVSLTDNWGFKLNGAPRQTITVRKGQELFAIKTFDSTVVAAYTPASQLAYVLAKYPDTLVPASILTDTTHPRLPTITIRL